MHCFPRMLCQTLRQPLSEVLFLEQFGQVTFATMLLKKGKEHRQDRRVMAESNGFV